MGLYMELMWDYFQRKNPAGFLSKEKSHGIEIKPVGLINQKIPHPKSQGIKSHKKIPRIPPENPTNHTKNLRKSKNAKKRGGNTCALFSNIRYDGLNMCCTKVEKY
jgi:hypothetical protein